MERLAIADTFAEKDTVGAASTQRAAVAPTSTTASPDSSSTPPFMDRSARDSWWWCHDDAGYQIRQLGTHGSVPRVRWLGTDRAPSHEHQALWLRSACKCSPRRRLSWAHRLQSDGGGGDCIWRDLDASSNDLDWSEIERAGGHLSAVLASLRLALVWASGRATTAAAAAAAIGAIGAPAPAAPADPAAPAAPSPPPARVRVPPPRNRRCSGMGPHDETEPAQRRPAHDGASPMALPALRQECLAHDGASPMARYRQHIRQQRVRGQWERLH